MRPIDEESKRTVTRSVRSFYDSFGWQKDERGVYKDTALFFDTRPVLAWYNRATHRRVNQFFGQGKYFLDAGSGAVPHPEYLEYSRRYQRRVCVDISQTGLQQARSRIRDQGLYVLGDVVRLPFRDGVFDATMAAHVLYHVSSDAQRSAILELRRTLAPHGVCVIIYSQSTSLLHLIPTPLSRIIRSLVLALKTLRGLKHEEISYRDTHWWRNRPSDVGLLYVHAHDLRWLRAAMSEWKVNFRSWRSVDASVTRRFVPNNLFGGCLMRVIFLLETLFPRALARVGYQMIIMRKG